MNIFSSDFRLVRDYAKHLRGAMKNYANQGDFFNFYCISVLDFDGNCSSFAKEKQNTICKRKYQWKVTNATCYHLLFNNTWKLLLNNKKRKLLLSQLKLQNKYQKDMVLDFLFITKSFPEAKLGIKTWLWFMNFNFLQFIFHFP